MNAPKTKASLPRQTNMLKPDADVIVIGAGPAGMSAAVELASAGCAVIVLDMQPTPGGQIFRALESNDHDRPATDTLLDALGPTYSAGIDLLRRFRATPGIDYRPLTTVWDLRSDGTVGWLKDDLAGYLRAPHVILANGAMERPVPFPGWTLPGVMTAGAVQTLLKAGRLQPVGRIVMVGTGPLIFLLADQLRRLGVKPALIGRTDGIKDKLRALAHIRPATVPALTKGLTWLAKLRLAGVPMLTGVSSLRAEGVDHVQSVSLTIGDTVRVMDCDLLVVHDGIVPSIDLAHGAGLALEWRDVDGSWRPRTGLDGLAQLVPGPSLTRGDCRIRISGDARQVGGADAAIAHGRHVARSILSARDLTLVDAGATDETAAQVHRTLASRPFIDIAFPPGLSVQLPDDNTIVCRCEEISAGTLRQKISEGVADMNQLRGTLRCGMGPCQGRSCTISVARLLAEGNTQSKSYPVPFTSRPPLRPLPLGALASLVGVDPELTQVTGHADKPTITVEDNDHA
ncbi:FAD-dependent oxidoreductase [Pseudomonas gingeri]